MDKEMSVYLATTWYPRGELPRFTRFLPMLEEEYAGIVISLIPSDDQNVMRQFTSGEFLLDLKLTFHVNEDGRWGRYMALKKALETPTDFIHYVDMDRLLHWVETQPEEWKHMVGEVEKSDCIIFGRTQTAFLTHPQALIATEMISNQVVSGILGKEMDVSAGSKSFSRSAAQYIINQCQPDNSIGTDAEWPIRLKQAGFRLNYIQVEGLDWESADQFHLQAANADEQAKTALEYDADPKNWSHRIEIASEIIRKAHEVSQVKYPMTNTNPIKPMEFDYDAVFDVDDYLYFYSEDLTDERTEKEVSALVSLLALDQPKKILDLACGFGRHTNRLAILGHTMTGVDITPGFLEIARRDAMQKGVDVRYQQNDMRTITFDNEFDCVLLLFTAFGYFSDEENLQVLINARNALLPGGLLIFDTPHRDTFLKRMQPYHVVEKEGNMMIDRMTFDSLQGRSYNKRIVFRDGIRKDKPFFVRLYNPNEIQALITQAGLILEHIYGGWEAQEVTSETNRIVVIARKPEAT
jgi:SAM-dependent methyltransferase